MTNIIDQCSVFAFIHILTIDTIAWKARVASARKTTHSVGACCVVMAIIQSFNALIVIIAFNAISMVTVVTLTSKRPENVWTMSQAKVAIVCSFQALIQIDALTTISSKTNDTLAVIATNCITAVSIRIALMRPIQALVNIHACCIGTMPGVTNNTITAIGASSVCTHCVDLLSTNIWLNLTFYDVFTGDTISCKTGIAATSKTAHIVRARRVHITVVCAQLTFIEVLAALAGGRLAITDKTSTGEATRWVDTHCVWELLTLSRHNLTFIDVLTWTTRASPAVTTLTMTAVLCVDAVRIDVTDPTI